MRFQLFEFLVVEFGFFDVVPCFEESFVGSCEGSSFSMIDSASSERIIDFDLIILSRFGSKIFGVDGSEWLRGISEREMACSLIHLLYF
jgi:hypothetical protein